MKIVGIREKRVSLAHPLSNAAIDFREMTASAVAVEIDAGGKGIVTGYGFSSIGRYAQGGPISERFAPRLLASPDMRGEDGRLDPARGRAAMMANEKQGGDGDRAGAVGVLDMALWDAAAKAEGVPLWRLLSRRFNGGKAHSRVPLYATGGHYHAEGGLAALRDEIKGYLDRGYDLVKIKCGVRGLDDDRARIETALSVLGGDGARLAVDVNCRCASFAEAAAMADGYAPYRLAWIEEPGHPHDFQLLAALTAYSETSVGTGENLFSIWEARNLLRYAGLRPDRDLIQIDPALAYGAIECAEIVEHAESQGWPRSQIVPHAGHLFAFHVVAGFALGAHEVAPRPDFVIGGLPAGVSVENGRATLPDVPGLGFERHERLWAALRGLGVANR